MHSIPPGGASPSGPQPSDHASWRLLFMLFGERPWFVTLWLALDLGALVALGFLAAPLLPEVLGALGLTGAALKVRASRYPPSPPDPSLDPPP